MLANSSTDLITTPVVLLASVWIAVWSLSRWRKLHKKKLAATTPKATGSLSPQTRADEALVAGATSSRSPQPRPSAMTASDVRSLAVELQQLLADLNDTSRRMAAQMDNRHTRLESLVAEADVKIARLQALQKAQPQAHGLPAMGPRSASQPVDHDTDPHADLACVTTHLNAIASSIHTPCSTSKDILHAPIDPTHRKIYDLADKGQSPRDIAQQLTKHPGEVELILALRRRSA